ncbi:MAG: Bug family tripartite tricarboxylate transporter substrate binding protein [Chloroflexota bacterium]
MSSTAWLMVTAFLMLQPPLACAASYYEGKTITIVVGYKPGGGYDQYARLLAKHLPRYIPGSPTVIVQNMPGGGSVIAANYIYATAKPDGLTIGTFNNSLVFNQLTKSKGVRFDLTKFAWIGSVASDVAVVAIRSDLPYKTAADLRNAKEIVMGATGTGDTSYVVPIFLKEYAAMPFKLVVGYSSSSDVMLAIERKEVDGRAGSYVSILPFIQRGLVRPLIRSNVDIAAVRNLPTDESLATSAKGKAVMAVRSGPEQMYRPYVATPGTPDSVMKILRDAFAQATSDKALLADAKKSSMTVEFTPADGVLKIVRNVLSQPPEIANEIGKFFKAEE